MVRHEAPNSDDSLLIDDGSMRSACKTEITAMIIRKHPNMLRWYSMSSWPVTSRLSLELGGLSEAPKERTDRLRIGFAKAGDVLLTQKGTVGEVCITPAVADYVTLTPQVHIIESTRKSSITDISVQHCVGAYSANSLIVIPSIDATAIYPFRPRRACALSGIQRKFSN